MPRTPGYRDMKAGNSSYRSLPDSERITNPTRVARLLDQLARRHALLTVEIPGHADRFTSCIVSVDEPFVLLDELLPADGQRLLLAERRLRVTGKLDGIDVRFQAQLARVDEQDGVITSYLDLPGTLEYRQRRMDFRAHIPLSQSLRVFVDDGEGTVIQGLLHDLSHGGAGILLPEEEAPRAGGRMYECAIELPGADWLYCSAELCYSRQSRFRGRLLVGTRFHNQTPFQARLVGQCIIRLEREQIRKRVAY